MSSVSVGLYVDKFEAVSGDPKFAETAKINEKLESEPKLKFLKNVHPAYPPLYGIGS